MLMGRKWAGVQFARADLTRSALRLLDDGEVRVPGESATGQVPLCPLAETRRNRPRPPAIGRWI